MANYYCSARTNYFRVKDEAAFKAWAKQHELEVIASEQQAGLFALHPNSDDGSFPTYDCDTDEEIDFVVELGSYLTENSVAVFLEAGAEKLRYINGCAVAVDAKGDVLRISLDDIYQLAENRFPGKEVTRAEY